MSNLVMFIDLAATARLWRSLYNPKYLTKKGRRRIGKRIRQFDKRAKREFQASRS